MDSAIRTASFEAGGGRLILADVGQNNIEEVDIISEHLLRFQYCWILRRGDTRDAVEIRKKI